MMLHIYEMMQFLLLFDMIQLWLTCASNLMVIYASVFPTFHAEIIFHRREGSSQFLHFCSTKQFP